MAFLTEAPAEFRNETLRQDTRPHPFRLSVGAGDRTLGDPRTAQQCRPNTTAGLYAACAVFVAANERAALVADAFAAMLTNAGRCEAVVTSG